MTRGAAGVLGLKPRPESVISVDADGGIVGAAGGLLDFVDDLADEIVGSVPRRGL